MELHRGLIPGNDELGVVQPDVPQTAAKRPTRSASGAQAGASWGLPWRWKFAPDGPADGKSSSLPTLTYEGSRLRSSVLNLATLGAGGVLLISVISGGLASLLRHGLCVPGRAADRKSGRDPAESRSAARIVVQTSGRVRCCAGRALQVAALLIIAERDGNKATWNPPRDAM